MSRTTIVDIANALGITPSTVSRALSGSSKIKPSTRKAVVAKAAELGYERNEVASGFRRGVTNTVGIVVPLINREFFSDMISTAESVLEQAGYTVLICQTRESEEEEKRALATLRASRVAGIMISHASGTESGNAIEEILHGSKIKLLQFDRVFEGLPGSTVVNDDFQAAYAAVSHLIGQGYRKIGAFTGFDSCLNFVNRYKGYLAALKDAGIKPNQSIVYKETIVRDRGYENAKKALKAGCDAIWSSGAFSALGAIQFLKEQGIKMPEDFGVAATANESFTSLITPSLTTVDQHPKTMGKLAAEAMLRLLDNKTEGELLTIPTDLIIRDSSSRK